MSHKSKNTNTAKFFVDEQNATLITEDTLHAELINPEVGGDGLRTLRVITEPYGTRGLDFRGKWALFVSGSFSDELTR